MPDLLNNPAIIGLVVAIPSFVLGYLAYRQSKKVDRATEQSGVADDQLNAVGQVLSGLNQLIDNLQDDNKELRENIKLIGIKLKEVVEERDALLKEINRLSRLYNINGTKE